MTDMNMPIEQVRPKPACVEVLSIESWEKLPKESFAAYAAFCAYRDCNPERKIRRAVESVVKDVAVQKKRYRVWRNWAIFYRWKERAADFDHYIEKLKQAELRKTIEAQGEMHRAVTGKMLEIVKKKLDVMNPAELTQRSVSEWVQTAIKTELEAAGLIASDSKPGSSQGELNFTFDFQGL